MRATDLLERRALRGTPRGADSIFDAARLGPLRASGQEPSRNRVPLLVAGAMLVVAAVGGSVMLLEQTRTRVTTLATQAPTAEPDTPTSVTTSDRPEEIPLTVGTSVGLDRVGFERTGPGAFDSSAGTVPNVVIRDADFRVTGGSVLIQPVSRVPSLIAFQVYRDPLSNFDGPAIGVRVLGPSESGIVGETRPISINGTEGQMLDGAFLREIVWPRDSDDNRYWVWTSGLSLEQSVDVASSLRQTQDGSFSLDLPFGLAPIVMDPGTIEVSPARATFTFEFEQSISRSQIMGGGTQVISRRPGGTLEIETGSEAAFESALKLLLKDATKMSNAKVADSSSPATDGAIITQTSGQVVALWYASGLVFKLTPEPESAVEVETWLNEMAVVSDNEWQLLVPSDWVARNDVVNTVEQLMEGVPTPAGFDTATILAVAAPGNPEQLASRTASLVACAWINQWLRAVDSGNTVSMDQAVSAMQTVSNWPAVEQLSQDSPARLALIDHAGAMATESGVVGDSEFTVGASYQQALGCF